MGADVPALECGRDVDELLEQVFTGRAEELDAHQRRCEHCSTVLARVGRQWAPLQVVGSRMEIPPPGLRRAVMDAVRSLVSVQWAVTLPAGAVRVGVGAGSAVVAGTVRISTAVVAAVAERAVGAVPGVRRAWARALPQDQTPTQPQARHGSAMAVPGWELGAEAAGEQGGEQDHRIGSARPQTSSEATNGDADGAMRGLVASPTGDRLGVGGFIAVQLLVAAEYGTRLVPLARAARRVVGQELSAVTSVRRVVVDVHIDDVALP
jgi:uncharacterized alkaline shock family protein YloU